MKKMMFLSKNWYFSVQKGLIYYTVNKSHHNSFILLVFSHVANFRYVANFRFLTLYIDLKINITLDNFGSHSEKNGTYCCIYYQEEYTLKIKVIEKGYLNPSLLLTSLLAGVNLIRIVAFSLRENMG